MSWSILFWLALPLPGYVALRRLSRDDLESGLLGVTAISYFYSLALLSPFSILCYALHLPVAAFSGAIALGVIAAIVEITRRRWWRDIGAMLLMGASFELLIVAVDMLLGARLGSNFGGDAQVHLSRIRYIIDHGFNNRDPFCSTEYFFPIYHTNLLHALFAACTQLTQCSQMEAWYWALPWSKLMIASGTYFMGWAVFGSRSAAWAAALCAVCVRGPFLYTIYPNQLSPFAMTPIMIGFVVQACRSGPGWTPVLKIAAGSLILGQLHSLYALFFALAAGPTLACVFAYRLVRRKPGRRPSAVCIAALATGLPFLLVSLKMTYSATAPPAQASSLVTADSGFVTVGNGWVMKNPATLFGAIGFNGFGIVVLMIGIAGATALRRRWEVLVPAGILLTMILIFYLPPLCAFVIRNLRETWIMDRFDFYFGVCHIVLLPAAIAFLLEPFARHGFLRCVISAAGFLAGLPLASHTAPDNWESIYFSAKLGDKDRQVFLKSYAAIMKLLTDFVPRGETVLVDGRTGISLTALYDCYLVASDSGSNAVPDLQQRQKDLAVMIKPDTPWEVRVPLLKKYGVRYVLPTQKPVDWLIPHVETYRKNEGTLIIKLKTE